jgi:hypothetical protein
MAENTTLTGTAKSPQEQLKLSTTSQGTEKNPDSFLESRSLAIAIENKHMISRADLEESLLKGLYTSVKSLESEVGWDY